MFEYKGYTVKKWDKKEPINGYSAKSETERDPQLGVYPTFLIQFEGYTIRHELFPILRSNSLKYKDLDDDTLMKTYLTDLVDAMEEQERMIEEAKTAKVQAFSMPVEYVTIDQFNELSEKVDLILKKLSE